MDLYLSIGIGISVGADQCLTMIGADYRKRYTVKDSLSDLTPLTQFAPFALCDPRQDIASCHELVYGAYLGNETQHLEFKRGGCEYR